MDLTKTGLFIQNRRKAKNLTQVQLAQKLNISEKTVSKWECGKGFPDTSLIMPLCEALNISANELLTGKTLSKEEYMSSAEENLIALKATQEKHAKRLLFVELWVIWLSVVVLLSCAIVSEYVEIPLVWKILILVFGFLNMFVSVGICLVIETKVGYYKCGHCGHKYIPTYKQILWSLHMSRTRYLKCPNCNKRSWNKKTTSLE